jgi:hypothetical protein
MRAPTARIASPPGANATQSADLVTQILDIENDRDQIAV